MLLKSYDDRKKVLDIFKGLYDHVSSSLGPLGHTSFIRKENGNHIITKDGVTICKHYKGDDDFSNLLIDIIKEVSQRTDYGVGDGTTSTIVFAYHLFEELLRLSNSGYRYVDLIEGVDEAVTRVLTELSKYRKDVTTTEELGNIAFVSSNNDREVADIIQKAIEEVGNDGTIITTRNRRYNKTVLDIREGFTFDGGYISEMFVTNPDSKSTEYHEPHVIVTDYAIHTVKQIWPLLQLLSADRRPAVLIADTIEEEALGSLIKNATEGAIRVCGINAPYYGDERKAFYEDVCDITGATFISKHSGKMLEDISLSDFGKCGKLDSRKKITTLINGAGDMAKIRSKVQSLKDEMLNIDITEEEMEDLTDRVNRLASGVAEIQIGGYTEAEIKEKKYRFDDALSAVQASYKSGTVVGGGITYINISKDLEGRIDPNYREGVKMGYKAVIKALYSPFDRLLESSNRQGERPLILGKIERHHTEFGNEYGYNIRTDEYCNLRDSGIIEPSLILKNVVRNSSSIVKLLLNSTSIIL